VNNQRSIFASGLAAATLILTGMLAGVLGAMPTTVLTQDKSWKVAATAFVPESWSFFTKDPDSAALMALRPDATDISQENRLDPLPQSLAINGFGISRTQRSYDTEKALYAGKVSDWVDCGGMSNAQCITAAEETPAQRLEAAKGAPKLCGEWLLAQAHVVPYAYREMTSYESKADKAAKVTVKCS